MKVKTTGQRLAEYMAAVGARQADVVAAAQPFCQKHGVKLNRSDLSQYISGKAEPRQEKLVMLSEALNVDVAWLMGYDVPMHPLADSGAEVTSVSMADLERDGLLRLTEREKRLVLAFRAAGEEARQNAEIQLRAHEMEA